MWTVLGTLGVIAGSALILTAGVVVIGFILIIAKGFNH